MSKEPPPEILAAIEEASGAVRRRVIANAQASRDRLKEIAQRESLAAAEMHRRARAYPELLAALEMVRDADDDCRRDNLPTIPPMARAKIDAAITKAKGA